MNYKRIESELCAAKQLVARGWCQGFYKKYDKAFKPHFCAIGAVREAITTDQFFNTSTMNDLLDTFHEANNFHSSIAAWNDAPQRTHAEVLAAFDKAIAYCQVRREPSTPAALDKPVVTQTIATPVAQPQEATQ